VRIKPAPNDKQMSHQVLHQQHPKQHPLLPILDTAQEHPCTRFLAQSKRSNKAGTAGLFIRKPNSESIYGLTVGHAIENLSLGSQVIQPARKHLEMDIDDVECRMQRLQHHIKSLTDQILRSKYEDELRKFQNDLAVLYGLKGANDRETRKNLKAGEIVSYEFCPVFYKGRSYLSD
jgi:hypothetical protein